VVTFNERLRPHLGEGDVLAMMAMSSEFDSMAVRWVLGLGIGLLDWGLGLGFGVLGEKQKGLLFGIPE